MQPSADQLLAPVWPNPALAAVRLARVAATIVLGLATLAPPHLAWLAATGGSPSPFARAFHRLLVWSMGIRVVVHAPRSVGRALLVANHVSWTDILVLGSVARTAFVAKSDVRGWPLLGPLARLQPTVFVERGRRTAAFMQVTAVSKALGRGSVAMFPEGTTGDGSAVLPFRSTLLASAAGRPIRPVAITYRARRSADWGPAGLRAWAWDGDKPFFPHFLRVVACGGADCEVRMLSAVAGGRDRKALAEACRSAIADALRT